VIPDNLDSLHNLISFIERKLKHASQWILGTKCR
jgi:hypothetical protein